MINNGGDNVVVYDPGSDQYIAARFNNDPADNPATQYTGFSPTATAAGPVENFGNDIDGNSIQRIPDGGTAFVNDQGATPGVTNICIAHNTEITTPDGGVLIQDLRAGDMVTTLDHGPQPIRWIYAFGRSMAEVAHDPRQGGIRIARGALGEGLPRRSLIVSRQHRLLIRSAIAKRMYGRAEVLVHAKDLLGLAGITPAPAHAGFLFYHLLLPRHEVIFAQGAATESLYLGKGALAALSVEAQDAFRALPQRQRHIRPARTLAKGAKARQLCKRHLTNRKALCTQQPLLLQNHWREMRSTAR